MNNNIPRVYGVLLGDIINEPGTRIKYGHLFKALEERFRLVGVYNARLRGAMKFVNALQTLHPNLNYWRERFYKNVTAFRIRSQQVADQLQSLRGQVDVVLQVGVLFDARWNDLPLPNVIYTDYTARLSAQKKSAGRSPFTAREREEWIELERQAFARAEHICTRSQLVRNSIIHDYDIAPSQVTVIGGGVNFDTLPRIITTQKSDAPTVLFIGKELYRKGGDLLLQAFAQARAEVPAARLLLVTKDPIPKHLPLEGVEVITPTWRRTKITELYRRADLFALPSRLETWGDVLLEAMAYQLPCIGVADDAMQEIIRDGTTGLIVPPGDVTTLAAALVRLLRDPSLRRELGCAGRRQLEDEYTWKHVVKRLAPTIEAAAKLRSNQRKGEASFVTQTK